VALNQAKNCRTLVEFFNEIDPKLSSVSECKVVGGAMSIAAATLIVKRVAKQELKRFAYL
jgi:hypothetical protein